MIIFNKIQIKFLKNSLSLTLFSLWMMTYEDCESSWVLCALNYSINVRLKENQEIAWDGKAVCGSDNQTQKLKNAE